VILSSELKHSQGGWTAAGNAVGLASLGLLAFTVTTEIHTLHTHVARAVTVALLVTAVLSWLLWMFLRSRNEVAAGIALVFMGLAGSVMVGLTPVAMVFAGVSVLSVAIRWRIGIAALVALACWLTMLISVETYSRSYGLLLGGVAAVLGGLVVGLTRRDAEERSAQLARMQLEVARTEMERARAELLSERNHMAREMHDILAHTLAALSLHLEAFSTVVDGEPDTSPAIRQQLERTKMLVRDGLNEARGAVRALRDEPAALGEQLDKLCQQHGAKFTASGSAEPLPAPAVLGLYRVAQEALTNVMKHAPGAPTSVDLTWTDMAVSLTVVNDPPPGGAPYPLQHSGSGYGLRGIAERVELLGGEVESGPIDSGWRVATSIPLAHDGTLS
jgi:signal transduction histidine kinase